MIDFDFNDDLNAAKTAPLMNAAEIRKQAHVANGGEATFPCPKCNGSGMTPWGRCFKCKGEGTVSRGVIAAAKGKITKANNIAQWKADHAAEIAFIDLRAHRWPFAASMQDAIENWGKLTDNQLAAVRKVMAQDAEKAAARAEVKTAAAPKIDMSAIEKMFAIASENKTNPKFFVGDTVISPAKAHSRNPGAIYVKVKGAYAGKIVAGRFLATDAAGPETVALLNELAADPRAAAAKWGKEEVRCCCCGIELTDPVSRKNGIGPICAENWGF